MTAEKRRIQKLARLLKLRDRQRASARGTFEAVRADERRATACLRAAEEDVQARASASVGSTGDQRSAQEIWRAAAELAWGRAAVEDQRRVAHEAAAGVAEARGELTKVEGRRRVAEKLLEMSRAAARSREDQDEQRDHDDLAIHQDRGVA